MENWTDPIAFVATTDLRTDYAYNSRFQVQTETVKDLLSSDMTLTREYEDDSAGNLIGRSKGYYLGAETNPVLKTGYRYDAAGRLEHVDEYLDETTLGDTFTYGYLDDTRNLLETMTGPVHTTTYSYESGRNAMTGIENKETVGTDSVVSNYAYTYNELGQRADREQSGTAFTSTTKDTFTYDYLGQVIASTNDTETGYAYNPVYGFDPDATDGPDDPQMIGFDAIGDRQGETRDKNGIKTYVADLTNQYDSVDGVTYAYDADGNLTGDGIWSYKWNGENRLVSATRGNERLLFTYDYQGRLVRKINQTENQSTGNWETDDEVVYLYDGWNRIAKYHLHTSSFTLQTSYLWGMDLSGSMQGAGGVGGLLKEGNRYPTYDANGNIVQKLDANGGTDMAVEYDPFGNIISGTLVGEYGFSTKPFVDGPDWYYYGFRYYDPVTGRWPSRDPIEEEGGLNLYGFVGNDSVNAWDFLGMKSWDDRDPLNVSMRGAQIFGMGFNGAGLIDSGADRSFRSTGSGAVRNYIKDYFDISGDGKLDSEDCPPFKLNMTGYSWGAWSVLQIAHGYDGSHNGLFEIRMGLVDPVSTLRSNYVCLERERVGGRSGKGRARWKCVRWSAPVATRPGNVDYGINYYQTVGGANTVVDWPFIGSSVSGMDVDTEIGKPYVTEGSAHVDIMLQIGTSVADAIFN